MLSKAMFSNNVKRGNVLEHLCWHAYEQRRGVFVLAIVWHATNRCLPAPSFESATATVNTLQLEPHVQPRQNAECVCNELPTTSQRQRSVYGATEIFESSMVTQPIGKNEAHSACYYLLLGTSAGTRIDITNEEGFHWKRFLRTQPVGRDIMGEGIYNVYAVHFKDKPALAFRCVGGITRIFIPSYTRRVPQFQQMPTNRFEENYPTVSTTSSSWMKQ